MRSTRPYAMGARADAVARTRERILGAVVQLATETFDLDPTLERIAARAGVSVQTLLRHFGTREALVDAAADAATATVVEERHAPVGDVSAAVRAVTEHYEVRGDFVVHLLGHEDDAERIRKVTGPGRELHREWVRTVFAPWLAAGPDPEPLVDLLVVATDVHTWKLLRRDRGLPPDETRDRVERLVRAVLSTAEGRS